MLAIATPIEREVTSFYMATAIVTTILKSPAIVSGNHVLY